ncbi:DUF982 domain-containing protein [Starkeya sp. ORNL1]|uniref:DUF982 domain-containing protein n=1 Tax=Starkeya sp. ORNL1 TaxID=2709380 RepID=UPI0014630F54|nr:DUF982 domain-containing protein [Starkeya sp. ORNL1]QJP14648.1 DUF982 domain-containing protein [Starkeya sp. ORNL1]
MAQIRMNPVMVCEDNGFMRTLADVEGAALFMLHQWPRRYRGTKLHIAAQLAALAAMEGSGVGTPEEFRDAFIEAAGEADILTSIEKRRVARISQQRAVKR